MQRQTPAFRASRRTAAPDDAAFGLATAPSFRSSPRPAPTGSMREVEARAASAVSGAASTAASAVPYFRQQWTTAELYEQVLGRPLASTLTQLSPADPLTKTVYEQCFALVAASSGTAESKEAEAKAKAMRDLQLAAGAPWYETRYDAKLEFKPTRVIGDVDELKTLGCGRTRAEGLLKVVAKHLGEIETLSDAAGGADRFAQTHRAADLDDLVVQFSYMLHAYDAVRETKARMAHAEVEQRKDTSAEWYQQLETSENDRRTSAIAAAKEAVVQQYATHKRHEIQSTILPLAIKDAKTTFGITDDNDPRLQTPYVQDRIHERGAFLYQRALQTLEDTIITETFPAEWAQRIAAAQTAANAQVDALLADAKRDMDRCQGEFDTSTQLQQYGYVTILGHCDTDAASAQRTLCAGIEKQYTHSTRYYDACVAKAYNTLLEDAEREAGGSTDAATTTLPMAPPLLPATICAPPRKGKSACILSMIGLAVKLPMGFAVLGVSPNKTMPMFEMFGKIEKLGWDDPLVDMPAYTPGASGGKPSPLAPIRTDISVQRQQEAAQALERLKAQRTGGLVTGYVEGGVLYRRTAILRDANGKPCQDEALRLRLNSWQALTDAEADAGGRPGGMRKWRVDRARAEFFATTPGATEQAFAQSAAYADAQAEVTKSDLMLGLARALDGEATDYPIRLVLYAVSEANDVRAIANVLDAIATMQTLRRAFVLKVYDESQFLTKADWTSNLSADRSTLTALSPASEAMSFKTQHALRRTAPILLGLPVLVSATQMAARFERVFYGPLACDVAVPTGSGPDSKIARDDLRYRMLPSPHADYGPILPPSLRPRAFAGDVGAPRGNRAPLYAPADTPRLPDGSLENKYMWQLKDSDHERVPNGYYGAEPAPPSPGGAPGWIKPWSDASDANAKALRYAGGIAHVVPYYVEVPMPNVANRGELELAMRVPKNPTHRAASGTPPEYSYDGDEVFGTAFHSGDRTAEVALTLSPGVVGEVASGPLACDAWVLDASTHHKFAGNLSGDMRLALRHFLKWWRHAGDVALHEARTQNRNVAIPLHLSCTCRGLVPEGAVAHQIRLMHVHALHARAEREAEDANRMASRSPAKAQYDDAMTGARSEQWEKEQEAVLERRLARRRWGLGFVVVADLGGDAAKMAQFAAMAGVRPGHGDAARHRVITKSTVDGHRDLEFYAVGPDHAAFRGALQHRLADTPDAARAMLFLADPALSRNQPRGSQADDGELYPASPEMQEMLEARAAEVIKKYMKPITDAAKAANKKLKATITRTLPRLLSSTTGKCETAWHKPPLPPMTTETFLRSILDKDELWDANATWATATAGPGEQGYDYIMSELNVYFDLTAQAPTYPTTPMGYLQNTHGLLVNIRNGPQFQEWKQAEARVAEATINLKNNDPAYKSVVAGYVENPDEAVYDGAGMQTVNFPDLREWFDPYPNAQPLYAPAPPAAAAPPPAAAAGPSTAPLPSSAPSGGAKRKAAAQFVAFGDYDDADYDMADTPGDTNAARRGDLRAFGCKSVEDAYMLAGALDIHNLCVMGYGLFASALTLQASVPGVGFDANVFESVKRDRSVQAGVVDIDDPDPVYPDRLCYLPWSITLASSDGQSIDECFQILGRTFVDMRDDRLPAGWVVRMLGARASAKNDAPKTLSEAVRRTHPTEWRAPPTMLAAMRRLALLEQASAAGAAPNPTLRERTDCMLGAQFQTAWLQALQTAPPLTPTARLDKLTQLAARDASLAKHYASLRHRLMARLRHLAADERGLTYPSATAAMLSRGVGSRQPGNLLFGSALLWRLFYATVDEFGEEVLGTDRAEHWTAAYWIKMADRPR